MVGGGAQGGGCLVQPCPRHSDQCLALSRARDYAMSDWGEGASSVKVTVTKELPSRY